MTRFELVTYRLRIDARAFDLQGFMGVVLFWCYEKGVFLVCKRGELGAVH